jgi:hypothetical protein
MAAAAVLAFAAASVLLSRVLFGQQRAAQSVAASIVAAGVPSYYAALIESSSEPPAGVAGDVVVRATATGRVLTTVTPPAREEFTGMSEAPGDRTFILAAEPTAEAAHPPQPQSGTFAAATRFFRLRFDPGRDAAFLTPLRVPALAGVSWFELSPDGSRLAVALTSRRTLAIRVFSLATGASRTWRVSSSYDKHQSRFAELIMFSWAGNRTIAYTIGPTALSGQEFAAGLLNAATAGGSLIRDTTAFPQIAPDCHGVITADGRRSVSVVQAGASWDLVECTLRRGRLTRASPARVVWQAGRDSQVEQYLWASPTGHALIVAGLSSRLDSDVVGFLDGSRFTILPGSAQIPFVSTFPGAAVAW